jgi:hypothetical protein
MESDWSRPPDGVPSRSETEGFATRTRRNLDFILAAHDAHEDVHIVTQMVLSLLGMVVYPFERAAGQSWQVQLIELENQGWPQWNHRVGGYQPQTLWDLIRVLRHATAHGQIAFSSDSRYLAEVTVLFTNTPPHGGPRWDGSIRGDDLLNFCHRYLDLMWSRVA